jgi:hypothetical protein
MNKFLLLLAFLFSFAACAQETVTLPYKPVEMPPENIWPGKPKKFNLTWFEGRHLKDVTPQLQEFLKKKKFTEANQVHVQIFGEKDSETWPGHHAAFVTWVE